MLIAQGQQQVSPSERHGLHPLVVPLSSGPVAREDDDAAIMGDEAVTGLLRWPTLSSAEVLCPDTYTQHLYRIYSGSCPPSKALQWHKIKLLQAPS